MKVKNTYFVVNDDKDLVPLYNLEDGRYFVGYFCKHFGYGFMILTKEKALEMINRS